MSFPGIPGIPGMQGVTQWVVRALSFHCVDAANALHAFVQPFRRTASRLQDGRAQHSFFSLRKCSSFFSEKMFPDTALLIFDEFSRIHSQFTVTLFSINALPVGLRTK